MRFTHLLIAVLSLLCLPMLAFARDLITSAAGGLRGHLHLVPGTARSILETRRMGLA